MTSLGHQVQAYTMVERRKKRKSFNGPGHAHELTFSCYFRRRHFDDESNVRLLLDAIDSARAKHNFLLWAYVVILEHVHLLIRPLDDEYAVADILKSIKLPVAEKVAAKSGASIPREFSKTLANGGETFCFWQPGGGYDRNLFTAKAIWKAIQYIHVNPVKRGLVERLEDYEWSSYRAYEGFDDVPLRVDRCEVWLN